MSKLTDLLVQRQALIDEGMKAIDSANKCFHKASAIDEEIASLVNRAAEILGGGVTETPKKQTVLSDRISRFIRVVPSRPRVSVGRTPSLLAPIREVLEKNNNEPMSQDALLSALISNGVEVNGKRPKHTLSAHVSYLVKKNILVRTDKDRIALRQQQLIAPRPTTQSH